MLGNLAAEHLEHDEDQHRSAQPSAEQQVKQRPTSSEHGHGSDHHHEGLFSWSACCDLCLVVQGVCQPQSSALSRPRQESHAWRVLVTALLLLQALDSRSAAPSALAGGARLTSYAAELASCLGFAAFAWYFGAGRALLGSRFFRRDTRLGDVAWALILGATVLATEILAAPGESLEAALLLPTTLSEKIAWCGLAAAIAASEEMVYRGYLLRELAARTTPFVGAVLQGLLFGIAHGRQGPAVTARFALYGALFALITLRRGSLLPCGLAHMALDLWAGLAH